MGSCISLTEEDALAHKPLQSEQHDFAQHAGENPRAISDPHRPLSQWRASESKESAQTSSKENGGAKSSQTFPEPIRSIGALYSDTGLRIFTFEELRVATKSFRKECLLGEGGFGSVYKGRITEPSGAISLGELVAVKKLNTEGLQGHKEWMAEVDILGQLHHANLVRLVGYCSEDDQRLLVYEFMPRGSLELHLFRRSSSVLSWQNRMKIALGAAKGLAYLHEEAERFVIYRDFKTSNILLDNDFNAKLSDFGLAKDGPEGDKTHVSTRVMGTYGYAAPEYVMTGHLTPKSDVYSYGVVLLEMVTGRRSMDKTRPRDEHNLVDWSRQFFSDRRKLFQIIDPRLEGRFSIRGAQKACILAQQCLCRDPKARPLMSDVVEALLPLQDLTDLASNYFQEESPSVSSQE